MTIADKILSVILLRDATEISHTLNSEILGVSRGLDEKDNIIIDLFVSEFDTFQDEFAA
jgi:hypothetical protein